MTTTMIAMGTGAGGRGQPMSGATQRPDGEAAAAVAAVAAMAVGGPGAAAAAAARAR